MPKWEYRWHSVSSSAEDGCEGLNELGAQGWEVLHVSDDSDSDFTGYFMKRPVSSEIKMSMDGLQVNEEAVAPISETDRTGHTWKASLPCPDCGQYKVIGILLVTEEGKHQHTRYMCTFWPKSPPGIRTQMCGWMGWSIPGWDKGDEND